MAQVAPPSVPGLEAEVPVMEEKEVVPDVPRNEAARTEAQTPGGRNSRRERYLGGKEAKGSRGAPDRTEAREESEPEVKEDVIEKAELEEMEELPPSDEEEEEETKAEGFYQSTCKKP